MSRREREEFGREMERAREGGESEKKLNEIEKKKTFPIDYG